jgi:hypothetical protein
VSPVPAHAGPEKAAKHAWPNSRNERDGCAERAKECCSKGARPEVAGTLAPRFRGNATVDAAGNGVKAAVHGRLS